MNAHLKRDIEKIKHRILELASDVEQTFKKAIDAFLTANLSQAREVIEHDQKIDNLEVDIEEDCLKALALYQPVATDLRLLIMVLKVNNDLERIADLASNIANYTLHIASSHQLIGKSRSKFQQMFDITQTMLHDVLDGLLNINIERARQVCEKDDIIDRLYVDIIMDVQAQLEQESNPRYIETYIYLISSARSIERAADYVTNLAEDVYYMTSGRIIRHQSMEFSDSKKRDERT